MSRFVLRDGVLTPKHLAARPPVARSALPCPAIRSDGMSTIRSMADGRLYDSRSAYERSVREAGCEIVGDDMGASSTPTYTPGNVERDVAEAIQQLGG